MSRFLAAFALLLLNFSPCHAEYSTTARAWFAKMKSHIEKHRTFPAEAKARGERGDVLVTFLIDMSGNLLSSKIHKPTCFEDLNREALEIIRRAAPFPTPPLELMTRSGVPLTIPIRFRYREEGQPLDPGITSRSECFVS